MTGILLPNRAAPAARAARMAQRKGAAPPERRRIDVDDWTQWHRIDGEWFEVALELLPPVASPSPNRWDALLEGEVRRAMACTPGTRDSPKLYGRAHLYAVSKRRVGRAEFRRRFPNGVPPELV